MLQEIFSMNCNVRWLIDSWKHSPLGRLRYWDSVALEIFAETIVQFCQTSQFQIRHRLLVLLHLVRVRCNITTGISLRHGVRGVDCGSAGDWMEGSDSAAPHQLAIAVT